MARNVLLLVAGAIVGATTVYWLGRDDAADGGPGTAGVPSAADAESPGVGASGAGVSGGVPVGSATDAGGPVAVRVAAFERALEATDVVDLESTIGLALARPPSRARDLDITASLARLAEMDPHRAVRFAKTSFLDAPFLIQAFAALARVDADAAVAELGSVTPAAKQRRIGLALLPVFGHERGVAFIGAALPEEARASFALDALVARAETDPAGAMAEAVTLSSPVQTHLLPRLAEAATRFDPETALALAESIVDFNARLAYRSSVLSAWADLDPEGAFAFAFLGGADPALLSAAEGAVEALAGYDPDRLLATIDELPPRVRIAARHAATQAIAERDPEAALAMLDTVPAGQEREQMLSTIAQAYGRRNPEAAIAWVRALSPQPSAALQGVLQGIAAVDANRAIDLLIEDLDGQSPLRPGVPMSFAGAMPVMRALYSSPNADIGRLADALLEHDDPQLGSLITFAVSIWQDRDAALSWTLANADRLDPAVFRGAAQRMAVENVDVALSMLDQLAPAHRQYWIEGVTSHLARTDIARARSLLSQLRGQPGYDAAYGVVLQTMTRTDPEGAARMLSDAPDSANVLQSAPSLIANRWASRDPAAAARWALTLEDPQMRGSAVSSVASMWAQRNAADAERWLFGLAIGPSRDAAASGYIAAAAQTGRFEPRLLEAYSSEQARQQGASRAIVAIGRADPTRAQALLDRYVTDPAIRAGVEAQLATSPGAGGPVMISDVVNFISVP